MIEQPGPEQVKAARVAAGMTQKECAERFGYAHKSWQQKEGIGAANRALSPGEYELLLLLAGQHPDYLLANRAK